MARPPIILADSAIAKDGQLGGHLPPYHSDGLHVDMQSEGQLTPTGLPRNEITDAENLRPDLYVVCDDAVQNGTAAHGLAQPFRLRDPTENPGDSVFDALEYEDEALHPHPLGF